MTTCNVDEEAEKVRPVIRSAFPHAISDRPQIYGAHNTTLLRTCFRIGEAINVGCYAVRTGKNLLIELYARVQTSWRDRGQEGRQHFIFKDIYHDKPPYMKGTFVLLADHKPSDAGSKAFLASQSNNSVCRLLARIKRGHTLLELDILSIWQASWEDVDHVAGIYGGTNGVKTA